MKSRKLTWLAMLLVLALALVACGGDDRDAGTDAGTGSDTPVEAVATEGADAGTDEAGEDAAAGGDDTAMAEGGCMGIAVEDGAAIVFSGWGDETEQQVYRDSITRFNEVCPGVTVDYQPVPSDFQTQMKAAFAGGTAPDVIYVDDQLMTALGRTGQLAGLDEYMSQAGVTREEFIPSLISIFVVGDVTFALPKDWGTLGLVYLPEAFEEAGIDAPTEDWTWDDLRTAAQTIEAETDFGGFCQGADWARFAPWAFSHGGSYASEDLTTATLNTPEIQQAAQLVVDMKEEGSLVTAADVGASWCGEAIGKKLVGMTLEGGWMVNTMNQDYPDVEWMAVSIPAGPEGKADVIFTNGIGVNANSDFPAAAAAFALFVTGRDNQAAIAETGFAYPTRADQLELVQNENDKAIASGGELELSRVGFWGPNTGRVNDAVSKAFERIFLGEQDVQAAFEQAQEEAQMALEEGQQ